MNENQLTLNEHALAVKLDKLYVLRTSMKPATRALISHCELVLTDSVLEVYCQNKIVACRIARSCVSIARLAENLLGVRVILKDWGGSDFDFPAGEDLN